MDMQMGVLMRIWHCMQQQLQALQSVGKEGRWLLVLVTRCCIRLCLLAAAMQVVLRAMVRQGMFQTLAGSSWLCWLLGVLASQRGVGIGSWIQQCIRSSWQMQRQLSCMRDRRLGTASRTARRTTPCGHCMERLLVLLLASDTL
jgi:hypothetical protein